MSCSEELTTLIDDDLLDFILKDNARYLEAPETEKCLMEDLPEPEVLDKEMDDFITSLLSSFEHEPCMLQGHSPANNDSGISEDQHLYHSPGSNLASSSLSSDIVHADHNYSLHETWPVLESVRPDMAEGVSIYLGMNMDSEGMSKTQEQSFCFPIVVAVDATPQFVPDAFVQADFPEVILIEGKRPLWEKEDVSVPTSPPPRKVRKQLPKKVRPKIQSKQSAQNSRRRRRRKMHMGPGKRMTACTARNHELENKIQLLRKKNMSLLKQLRRLQALVKRFTTKTTIIKTCTMMVVMSFCLFKPQSICSFQNTDTQGELRALPQLISELPNQVAPDVQEDAALEGFSPDPDDLSLLGIRSQSWEEVQSPPNPDPSYFNNSSSSTVLVSAASQLGPPQPQEQLSQSNPLQMVVLVP
ncbi:cyclic AMP-responsive element-binding protein 3 [Colius striatus]|uniref:cyclic AMP-responsive element-binding protein 3 n=1 Tax=Colius striatus TaxID=57412 RepID=UPI002B1D5E82|nr:cyclic AMP-responsive element-binding protein 3 [Colius striatus]